MAPPFVIRDTNSTSHASVPTKAPMLIAVDATLLTATFLVLIGRFYSRYSILKRVGKDDWCILGAAVCTHVTTNVEFHDLTMFFSTDRHVLLSICSPSHDKVRIGSACVGCHTRPDA
jgi:hypothetical protein